MNSIQNYSSILRGLNTSYLDSNEKLTLQVIDWKTCDKEINEDNSSIDEDDLEGGKELEYNFEYLITLFGITSDNKSICIDVHGFKPYFYIKVPPKWDKNSAKKFIEGLKSKFTGNLKKFRSSILDFKLLKKMIFKGFSNNQKHKFIKIIFKNKKCMMLINYLIKNNNEAFKEIAKKNKKRKKQSMIIEKKN